MMIFGLHRRKPTDFTRQRKIGFRKVLTSILVSLKHSLSVEIDNFVKKLDTEGDLTFSKQAYSQARQNLLPSAFVQLNDIVLEEVYNNDFKTFNGFRLIAVDGSSIELPNTKQMREIYGVFSQSANYPAARICTTYDVLNEIILGGKLFPYRVSEKTVALELIPKAYPCSAKDIFIYDRGFCSVRHIQLNIEHEKYFVLRVQKGFLKEIDDFRNSQEVDKTITIKITKRRIAVNKIKDITEPFELVLRCVRIKLEKEDEILVTNLTPEQMSVEELGQIYNYRWKTETNYNYLKNILEIENFTGDTDICIQQDFFATLYISNLASIMTKDAQERYEKDNADKPKKYKYKINRHVSIAYLKEYLLDVFLQDDPGKAKKLYNKFIKKLAKHVIPIRKYRKFERPTRHKPKFGRTNKKTL